MRVLHFYKTYLSETVGGIEQVIFQLCESSGSWGIDNHVLTLSSDPHPPVVPFGGHVVHRARLREGEKYLGGGARKIEI